MASRRPRLFGVLLALAGAVCTCRARVDPVDPSDLAAEPAALAFATTYLGESRSLPLLLSNRGGPAGALAVQLDSPFSVTPGEVKLGRGDSLRLEVTFTPPRAGHFTAELRVGELAVPVEGEGLDVPSCAALRPCHRPRFDLAAQRCVEDPLVNGTACATRCVAGGTCQGGRCLGQALTCDDADRCTVDLCSEQDGCAHTPLTCPGPLNRCQAARCDAAAGCVVEDVLDGTLCGPDDCLATQVDVCLAGQCTRKLRPPTARCENRWVPLTLPPRYAHGLAYDSLRRRVVVFGGAQSRGLSVLGDTWEWDGTRWELKVPLDAPAARHGVAMTFDAARGRAVLFGGYDGSAYRSDTWEWDGTTWLQRAPLLSPPVMAWPSMTYDSERRVVVLFGRSAVDSTSQTWEWNGTTWSERTVAAMPSPRTGAAMAYDASRKRVVLFGGYDRATGLNDDTWEWDGAAWTAAPQTLPGPQMTRASMAYDLVRQRLVLFTAGDSGTPSRTYEWTAAGWSQRVLPASPPSRRFPATVWDGTRGQVMLLGGESPLGLLLADTWELDGTTWSLAARTEAPQPRTGQAMAFDQAQRRLVLYGGQVSDASSARISDTWEWSGADAGWARRMPPASPPQTYGAGMAYDALRARTVLPLAATWEWDGAAWHRVDAGAPGAQLVFDTDAGRVVGLGRTDAGLSAFEWDGAAWARRTFGPGPPPRSSFALAYDTARQRLVLFGGTQGVTTLGDTWELDGTTWVQRFPATSPPPLSWTSMAFDAARGRSVLVGGYTGLTTVGDTWEWDGNDWARKSVVSAPPAQFAASMAYDTSLRRVVYFGASLFVLLP